MERVTVSIIHASLLRILYLNFDIVLFMGQVGRAILRHRYTYLLFSRMSCTYVCMCIGVSRLVRVVLLS